MTLKIDKAGRVILPKSVRQRFNLTAGSTLELAEAQGGVVLRPVAQKPPLIKRNGLLVHRGKAPKHFDWERMVEDLRDERVHETAAF